MMPQSPLTIVKTEPIAPLTVTKAEPDQPSVLSRIVDPTLAIPRGLFDTVKAGLSTEDATKMIMGIVENLVTHVKQGAATMSAPGSERVSTGLAQMAGGLPVVGPFMDAVAGNDLPSMVGQAIPLALGALAPEGAAAGANAASGPLESAAIGTFKRAAKVPIPIVKKTRAFRATGDLAAGETELARNALESGVGHLTPKNAETSRQTLAAAGQAKRTAVAASQAMVPRQALLDTMDGVIAQTNKSEPFADAPVRQLNDLKQQLMSLPASIPIRDAENLLEGIYRKNEASFSQGPGAKSPTQATAEKAIGRTIKDFAAANVPGVPEANAAYGKSKPVALAISRGAWRAGHQNPLSVPEILAALGGGAAGGWKGAVTGYGLGALQRPGPLSSISQILFDLSQKMKRRP